jgi:uncharacterized protein (TIGR00297 family)
MTKFLIGLSTAVMIAYLAYRARSLNKRGAIAAAILGTIVFGLGGSAWATLMLTFFISSSALSRFSGKAHVNQDFAKGSRRDAAQVTANGGTAGVLALTWFVLSKFIPASPALPALWLGFAASLAGANADTWGTELGIYNPRQPILLTTFKRVPKGTSGGVSGMGTLAALAGAGLVGGMAILCTLLGWAPASGIPLGFQFMIVTLGGFAGALIDSCLGATVQVIYYCPSCEKETERHPQHICGTATTLKRGWPWLNNDWVNLACTLSAGLIGLLWGL